MKKRIVPLAASSNKQRKTVMNPTMRLLRLCLLSIGRTLYSYHDFKHETTKLLVRVYFLQKVLSSWQFAWCWIDCYTTEGGLCSIRGSTIFNKKFDSTTGVDVVLTY